MRVYTVHLFLAPSFYDGLPGSYIFVQVHEIPHDTFLDVQ